MCSIRSSCLGWASMRFNRCYSRYFTCATAAYVTLSVAVKDGQWPRVAVQLPIFNEQHVVERLIDAAAALDYPPDRLEIQVLDDSTDRTTELAEARAAWHRGRGVNVRVLPGQSQRLQGGALAGAWLAPAPSSSRSSMPTSGRTPTSCAGHPAHAGAPRRRHGADALVAPERGVLPAHPCPVAGARRPLRGRADRAQPLGAC